MPSPAATVDLRQSLQSHLAEARARTDELFDVIHPEALHDRPIPERHRIIFYLGHLEAFDWNLIRQGPFALDPFNKEFDQLFAFGIDPTNGDLPTDQPSDWPPRAAIRDYSAHLRRSVDACLGKAELSDSAHAYLKEGLLFHVAVEHRLMHAETLAYMFHRLPLKRKKPQPIVPETSATALKPSRKKIPAGTATLGLPRAEGAPFGWDNEFELHTVHVPEFAIDAYPVTNGEYLNFIGAGGYDDPNLWSPADWQWITSEGIKQPRFWVQRGQQWHQRTMFADVALPLDWPVYVSHAEASAYARWRGKALPTEAQWHRAAYGTPQGTERAYPWGEEPPQGHHGNFDFQRWTPAPVNAHPAGASAFGVTDLLGNGWEWTSTPFASFAGFQPFPFYPGYSANFFDNKHYVMKGGSANTAKCMLRRSFRNWFQAHYQYVYASFRCVEN
jgi:ergothioneine biosynthesis protein EgtB